MIASAIEGMAEVAALQGQMERAARLWGAAESTRQACGAPLPPTENALYEPFLAKARAELDDNSFSTAWAAGKAMNLAQAIQFASGEETQLT